MDVENPLQAESFPLAKLVCIEVMGQLVEDFGTEPAEAFEDEYPVVNIHVSCNKCIYKVLNYFCAFIGCLVCFGGFFIFITGLPFV
jgi:hypothetical protein